MRAAKAKGWTLEEFMALPAGGPFRYEIVGEELLMTPSPDTRHQRIARNLLRILDLFLQSHPLGEVFGVPYDVVLSHDPLRVVQPDLLYVSRERRSIIGPSHVEGSPDLVVEILSEGTGQRDRRDKFSLYERSLVPEYWIVDPESESVQSFRLSDGRYADSGVYRTDTLLSTPLLPGLAFAVRALFPA